MSWKRKPKKASQLLGKYFDRAMNGDVAARSFVINALKAAGVWPMVRSAEDTTQFWHVTSMPANQVLELIRGLHR